MFKGTIAIKPFITMLSMAEAVNHITVLKITNEGLEYKVKDAFALLDFTMPRKTFIQYDYDHDDGKDIFLILRPAEVLRFFMDINDGYVRLCIDDNNNVMNIRHEIQNRITDFTTAITTAVSASAIVSTDVIANAYPEKVPDFTPVVKLLIMRDLLLEAIERIGISRYFRLVINDEAISFRQPYVSLSYKYGKDVSMKMYDKLEACHDVLALVPILKAVPDCNYIMLYGDKIGNLKLEFLLPFKCNANYYVWAV